jgi:hypothetical protein
LDSTESFLASRYALNKLTPQTVRRRAKPGRYADGGGLYLQV